MQTNLTSHLRLVSDILCTWPRAKALENDAQVLLSYLVFHNIHENSKSSQTLRQNELHPLILDISTVWQFLLAHQRDSKQAAKVHWFASTLPCCIHKHVPVLIICCWRYAAHVQFAVFLWIAVRAEQLLCRETLILFGSSAVWRVNLSLVCKQDCSGSKQQDPMDFHSE